MSITLTHRDQYSLAHDSARTLGYAVICGWKQWSLHETFAGWHSETVSKVGP